VGCSRHDKEPSYPIQVMEFEDPNNCEFVSVIMSSESSWLNSYRFWWTAAEVSTVRKFIMWNTILVVFMEQNITSVRLPVCDLVPANILGFSWNSWSQTLAAVHMRPALFWDLTQHRSVIPYRRSVTIYLSHLQGSNSLLYCPETSVRIYHLRCVRSHKSAVLALWNRYTDAITNVF